MDILGLGGIVSDLVTPLLFRDGATPEGEAKPAPREEEGNGPDIRAVILAGVAFAAILAVAVTFVFSPAGKVFIDSLAGGSDRERGALDVADRLGFVGWALICAFILPTIAIPVAAASMRNRAARLAIGLMGVLTVGGIAAAVAATLPA